MRNVTLVRSIYVLRDVIGPTHDVTWPRPLDFGPAQGAELRWAIFMLAPPIWEEPTLGPAPHC